MIRIRCLLLPLLLIVAAPLRAEDKQTVAAARHVKQTIAHRGSSVDRPENTLSAYRRALEVGATALEIDVRTTKDGALVSLHDATVNRTTNGKGKVNDLTLAELRKLDAGSFLDARFKDERVPTVQQVLELCKGKIDVLLDLKETGDAYAKQVAGEVQEHGNPREIIVGVRSVEQAKLFRKLLPEARQLGLIPKPGDIDAFAEAGVETIRLWPRWLKDEALVPRVRKHGLGLHLGTQKGTKAEVLALLPQRPESLSSDDPKQLLATLAELGGLQPAIDKGQRVFSAGHSFHVFMPRILSELARSADIKDHTQVGVSSIGGSRVIQHWNRPDEKNTAKKALATGKVDVLTLSPIWHPDEGIDKFTELALKHNPDTRVLVQAFWLPYDVFDVNYKKKRPEPVVRNKRTSEELRKIFAPYNKTVVDQVEALNKKHGKEAVFIVPCGQAQILLREKIIEGKAPGLTKQDDLFRDKIGHATAPLQALAAYCHYAVIYRRSPVGLPMPGVLAGAKNPDYEKLNRLLQELAWQAVLEHPHSGVTK